MYNNTLGQVTEIFDLGVQFNTKLPNLHTAKVVGQAAHTLGLSLEIAGNLKVHLQLGCWTASWLCLDCSMLRLWLSGVLFILFMLTVLKI